jgi:hypothetical protein
MVRKATKKPTTKPEPTGKNGLALHADDLRGMGEDVAELLAQLDPAKAKSLIYNWHFWARPNQLAPSGTWNTWFINAGRGFGKTRAAMEVGKFKYEESPGAWYVQGQTPTAEFTQFVDTYLNKWTGFVAETVFDVNCLVLDEENVIFSAYNKEVFDFCKKHRINPIISELRHSYFWDGGISCCTQDLTRRGGLETYL